MSIVVLERISGFLQDQGLIDGFGVKYYRWMSSDVGSSGNFIVLRSEAGSGQSDVYLQRIPVRMILVGEANDIVGLDTLTRSIQRLLRTGAKPDGIVKLEPTSEPVGPMFLENDRPVFEINFTAYTTDQ